MEHEDKGLQEISVDEPRIPVTKEPKYFENNNKRPSNNQEDHTPWYRWLSGCFAWRSQDQSRPRAVEGSESMEKKVEVPNTTDTDSSPIQDDQFVDKKEQLINEGSPANISITSPSSIDHTGQNPIDPPLTIEHNQNSNDQFSSQQKTTQPDHSPVTDDANTLQSIAEQVEIQIPITASIDQPASTNLQHDNELLSNLVTEDQTDEDTCPLEPEKSDANIQQPKEQAANLSPYSDENNEKSSDSSNSPPSIDHTGQNPIDPPLTIEHNQNSNGLQQKTTSHTQPDHSPVTDDANTLQSIAEQVEIQTPITASIDQPASTNLQLDNELSSNLVTEDQTDEDTCPLEPEKYDANIQQPKEQAANLSLYSDENNEKSSDSSNSLPSCEPSVESHLNAASQSSNIQEQNANQPTPLSVPDNPHPTHLDENESLDPNIPLPTYSGGHFVEAKPKSTSQSQEQDDNSDLIDSVVQSITLHNVSVVTDNNLNSDDQDEPEKDIQEQVDHSTQSMTHTEIMDSTMDTSNEECSLDNVDNQSEKTPQDSPSQIPSTASVPTSIHYSMHSIENARYSIGENPSPDHSNDDRYFVCSTNNSNIMAFGVFDGHDGSNASDFASDYMKKFFHTKFQQMIEGDQSIDSVLQHLFKKTEEAFFQSMSNSLSEKKNISQQLKGFSSYQAYIQFPHLVARLQEIEPLISGGTTAVIAVLIGDTLYVANTGDSRAVLVDDNQGTLVVTQLSEDHTVDNEKELQRLEAIGLNRHDLMKSGRLGSQENTRCIGDFLIKEGYTELDTISHATESPGIALPSIKEVKLSHNSRYLLLMTDGVYKSIECMFDEISSPDTMRELAKRLQKLECQNNSKKEMSSSALLRLEEDHHRTYQEAAQVNVRSPRAVQYRKRDDMTLVVCQFGQSIDQFVASNVVQIPADVQPVAIPRCFYSNCSIENARYSVNGPPCPDHPNDDRSFVIINGGNSFKAFGIFDGHDGSNASIFASDYMERLLQAELKIKIETERNMEAVLQEMFAKTDGAFFYRIQKLLNEKKHISEILKGFSSYEAYVQFPDLVARLQEIEPLISGGTTAVIAVLIGDTLYVANTGDSRAVLVQETDKGIYVTTQLTEDHTIDNEHELWRLESLGLNPNDLKKAGRLGSQENTRCIGNYLIKEGYTEVDTISHAVQQPGIAIPSIKEIKIPHGSQYLLLMTDGVYKSLESMSEELFDVMQELTKRLQEASARFPNNLKDISKHVVSKIQQDHHRTYQEQAQYDSRSPLAVQCRKRDDMSLIVYGFSKK